MRRNLSDVWRNAVSTITTGDYHAAVLLILKNGLDATYNRREWN